MAVENRTPPPLEEIQGLFIPTPEDPLAVLGGKTSRFLVVEALDNEHLFGPSPVERERGSDTKRAAGAQDVELHLFAIGDVAADRDRRTEWVPRGDEVRRSERRRSVLS